MLAWCSHWEEEASPLSEPPWLASLLDKFSHDWIHSYPNWGLTPSKSWFTDAKQNQILEFCNLWWYHTSSLGVHSWQALKEVSHPRVPVPGYRLPFSDPQEQNLIFGSVYWCHGNTLSLCRDQTMDLLVLFSGEGIGSYIAQDGIHNQGWLWTPVLFCLLFCFVASIS